MATYKEIADGYAARITRISGKEERLSELQKIIIEIDKIKSGSRLVNDSEKKKLLQEFIESLRRAGFKTGKITASLEEYGGLEELIKSGSSTINN